MAKESVQKESETPKLHLTKAMALAILWKLKQLVAAVLGLILGFIPFKSYFGFILFFLAQFLVVKLYAIFYNVPDYVLDLREIVFEALMTSCGCFVLFWIVTFSVIYF